MKTGRLSLLMCSAAFAGTSVCHSSAAEAPKKNTSDKERPNILWITFEDTSSSNFGCYGNKDVNTPVADSLAAAGIQYMNAWSVAPQSSPARSTLITGCYATTYGMDVHPVSQETPDGIFFPQLLRDAGYYCTNNSKTHYNTTIDNKSCWDECDKKATYNSPARKPDQPFFAVFNSLTSHMGRIRTFHTDGRRDYTTEGIYPSRLTLPSYAPDLPEVRSDYAGHLESTQDVDKWLGIHLAELKAKGLDENTIVFFFSDHGGCIPRGKGYLYESGLRVPLIVYFPEKWRHLAGCGNGKQEALVNFTDLGPTVLSLAGIKPPKHMQGKALHGKYASKEQREFQFAFGANQLHHFMPMRAVTDGKYSYIRSYIPYRQFGLRNYYQWGMPSNKAWDDHVLRGHNTRPEWSLPFEYAKAEMLFDIEKDPGQINDLSENPEYAEVLKRMSAALEEHVRSTMDLGFFIPDTRTGVNQYDMVRKTGYPLEDMYALAEAAGMGRIEDLKLFEEAVACKRTDFRFWGAVGYATLARAGKISECPAGLSALLDDSNPYVAAEAAYAMAYMGQQDKAICRMLEPAVEKDRKVGYSVLECLALDKTMRPYIMKYKDELWKAAETLPRVQNEDAGFMARGILATLGELDIRVLHGEDFYEKGLKLNRGRRAMGPMPY